MGNGFRFHFRLVQPALAPRGQFCGPGFSSPRPILCRQQNPSSPRLGYCCTVLICVAQPRPPSLLSLSLSQTHAVAGLGFQLSFFPGSARTKGSPSATSSPPLVRLKGTSPFLIFLFYHALSRSHCMCCMLSPIVCVMLLVFHGLVHKISDECLLFLSSLIYMAML